MIMKTKTITAVLAAIFLLSATCLHSQAPQSSRGILTTLQTIKAANQALIDKQQKTLQGLDDLQKSVEEIKIMGKRS